MARAFQVSGKGPRTTYAAALSPAERTAVAHLLDEVREIVAPAPGVESKPAAAHQSEFAAIIEALGPLGRPAPDPDPDRDPALARLIPDAHRQDPEVAAEFRRLTEHGLRERKAAGLALAATVLRRSGPVALSTTEAAPFLTALTDARLVIADRLEIRDEEDLEALEQEIAAAPDPDVHPLVHLYAMYDFLTWLQESLSVAMLSARPQA